MQNLNDRVIYTAYFIDDVKALREQFPHGLGQKKVKLFGHHLTIEYKPANGIDDIEVGKKSTLRIIGRVTDPQVGIDALLVYPDDVYTTKKDPHITLATSKGAPPGRSNEAIAKAIEADAVESFDTPIEVAVTQGYFNGRGDVTSLSN